MEDRDAETAEDGSLTRKVKLSLEGDGIAFEREIDEVTALDILAVVMSGGGTITSPQTPTIKHGVPRPQPRTGAGRQSLREYLDEVQPKRNPDKILAIAKYLSNETENFTRKQVQERFRDAAEPVPGNYGRDFTWCVRNGWLAPVAGSQDEYYVTKAGNDALAEKFSSEIKKKTTVPAGRRRRGGRSASGTAGDS
jgi:hypothetical protein